MKKEMTLTSQLKKLIFIIYYTMIKHITVCIAVIFFWNPVLIHSADSNSGRITFKENKGQVCDQYHNARPDIVFSGINGPMIFHLKKNGISYQFSSAISNLEKHVKAEHSIYRVDLNWLNSNQNTKLEATTPVQGYENYYLPGCESGINNVRSYSSVKYHDIYNGIDLHYYEKNGSLKYDYILKPYSDYKLIRIEIKGADNIYLNNKNELIISTRFGNITEEAPAVFQNGKQLKSSWLINNNIVGFSIQDINPELSCTIDPAIRVWGTYYGGTGDESYPSCTSDASGNSYLLSQTNSSNGTSIATLGSYQTTFAGAFDAMIVKFDPSGVRLWSTYYGGSNSDFGRDACIDALGNVFMAGDTQSPTGIGTPGCHQPNLVGLNTNAFLVKFDAAGVRQWATYFGNSSTYAKGCSVDASGNIFMSGQTNGTTNISTTGSHQPSLTVSFSNPDAYLAKFNTAGVLQWGTYYGGSGNEYSSSCPTDASGNVFLVGLSSSSTNISTAGAHQVNYSGSQDMFVAKFNTNGVRQWGTYYPGIPGTEPAIGACDLTGNIYIACSTTALIGVSTSGCHQPIFGGGTSTGDAYVVKFNTNGVRRWGTYYGGINIDAARGLSVDGVGNVYLSGVATSTNAIATSGNHQNSLIGFQDAFLAKFDSIGVRQWGTYYGGCSSGVTTGMKNSADMTGHVYLCGQSTCASGTVIASTGSHQPLFGGGALDLYLVKLTGGSVTEVPSLIQINSEGVIFPNPSSGQFILKGYNESSNAELFNCLGQKISDFQLEGKETTIDIISQVSGIYILKIYSKQGIVFHKLVKE